MAIERVKIDQLWRARGAAARGRVVRVTGGGRPGEVLVENIAHDDVKLIGRRTTVKMSTLRSGFELVAPSGLDLASAEAKIRAGLVEQLLAADPERYIADADALDRLVVVEDGARFRVHLVVTPAE